jgi:hypothetical protein
MTGRFKTVENGNRDSRGRWLPGHSQPGPGRPRGLDFRRVVEEKAEAEGFDLDEAIWEIVLALFEEAKAGSVAAAKLLLDRLCGPVTAAVEVEIQQQPGPVGPPIPSTEKLLEDLQRIKELSVEFGHEPLRALGDESAGAR